LNPLSSESNNQDHANNPDDLIVIIDDDSPGDTTVRPARFEVPQEWPRPQLPKQLLPQSEKP
jgi:hypothetical protein